MEESLGTIKKPELLKSASEPELLNSFVKRRRILPSTYQLLVKNIIRAGFVLLDSGISVCQVRCGESSSCVWDGEGRLSALYNGPVVEDAGLSVSANNGDCISTGWLWEPDTWETEISHCPPAWATAPSPYRWTERERDSGRETETASEAFQWGLYSL